MFGDFGVADRIAIECAAIDVECRNELRNQRRIVSERDYVTALTTRMHDRLGQRYGCWAQTQPPRAENENGVDGIIVFRSGAEVKAGIFEAKRPRFMQNNYAWDYLSTRNVSHFSEQIEKQKPWRDQLALWEMFFNEGVDGFESPPTEYFGSSCVWHNNAYDFMHIEKLVLTPWSTAKLKQLLANSCVSFYSVIYDIISCKAGKKLIIDKSSQSFIVRSTLNDNVTMEVPVPLEFEKIGNDNFEGRVNGFLEKNNLDSYTYIDLNSDRRWT